MLHISDCRTDSRWAVIFGLIIALSPLLPGCGEERAPHLTGQGEFEITGDLEEEVDCKLYWRPMEVAGGGANGRGEFKSPGLRCGPSINTAEGRVFDLAVVLWKRDDGSYPAVVEGTYTTELRTHDCAVGEPSCAAGYMEHDDDAYRTLPDRGELTITEHREDYVSGEVDVLYGVEHDESKTIRIQGTFYAARR